MLNGGSPPFCLFSTGSRLQARRRRCLAPCSKGIPCPSLHQMSAPQSCPAASCRTKGDRLLFCAVGASLPFGRGRIACNAGQHVAVPVAVGVGKLAVHVLRYDAPLLARLTAQPQVFSDDHCCGSGTVIARCCCCGSAAVCRGVFGSQLVLGGATGQGGKTWFLDEGKVGIVSIKEEEEWCHR